LLPWSIRQSHEKGESEKQRKKREARAAKKGKGGAVDNDEDDDGDDGEKGPSGAREWLSWFLELVFGFSRDLLVLALVLLLVTEGVRYMPRATFVSCDKVLGGQPGGNCVMVPGLEEPLECKIAMTSRPRRGAFPSLEQHAARACYRNLPKGVLKPSTRYYWDSAGITWVKLGMLQSVFQRPWENDRFTNLDKSGGAYTCLVPKSFQERIVAFYAKFSPETLENTGKLDNLMAKHANNANQVQKDAFEAKTFAALHAKYDTGAMGSVISPITGGIDASGAVVTGYRYVGRTANIYDRWAFFVTDVAPDYYYLFSTDEW